MPVTPARAVAFDILLEVEQRQSFAVDLLHSRRTEDLSSTDRALCMQLVMGVLRWQSRLDAEIAGFTQKKLDLEVRLALRLALFQMRHLDRVPQRAAVNESVELVKRARKKSAATFVNAGLRKLAAGPQIEGGTPAERWAHPSWLVERWSAHYGVEKADSICRFDQHPPETAVRLPRREHEAVAQGLATEGIRLAPGVFLANARRVLEGDVTQTAAFREGRVTIQDEGSQLVAMLVGEGRHILDCCAAPGGKTAAMADRNPDARILAVELHEHRLRLMRKMVKAPNVEFLKGDITEARIDGRFDRILADVPCSGTGTIARNPEIKWRLTAEDIGESGKTQKKILSAALERLESGGRLVYSTCSLEGEENEQVVEEVVRKEFRIVDCAEVLAASKRSGVLVGDDIQHLCQGPYLRTIPGVHPCDGFFAAILERS